MKIGRNQRGYLLQAGFLGALLLQTSCTDMNRNNGRGTNREGERASMGSGLMNSGTKADVRQRVTNAAEIFRSLVNSPDKEIPQELLRRSKCIAVIPDVLNAAFVVGAAHGRGVASCRTSAGRWSEPAFVSLTGASFGWQIGARSSDVVMFMVNNNAPQTLPHDNIGLGADVGVSAGPFGRDASLNTTQGLTGVYTYASAEGLFAGAAIQGGTLNTDPTANEEFYGRSISNEEILQGRGARGNAPAESRRFIEVLPRGRA